MMELLQIWVFLLIIALVIEAVTQQLTLIWFAAGALVAVIISLLGGPFFLQAALFLIVSILLMVFTRPIAIKLIYAKKEKTNVDALAGMEAVVTTAIDPDEGVGQIKVAGAVWSAKPLNRTDHFQVGDHVIIERVEGVKAVVKPQE